MPLWLLAIVFVAVPLVELYVILQVSHAVGILGTIAMLVVVSVVGAWLVKREGMGVLRRAQQQMAAQRVPGVELVDGVLILFAGALLVTPGFVSDVVGILLLLPPVRATLRVAAIARLRHRVLPR